MLSSLIPHLNCDVCGRDLIYDPKATFDSYYSDIGITVENIENKIEEVVGSFLIYECYKCKCVYKYTYKEIEKVIRQDITKQMLLALARGQMKNMGCVMDGVLIYCGKCSGFDGKGSCTKKIYDKCEVKRFPNVI